MRQLKHSEDNLCGYASFNMASFFIRCEKYSFFKYVICKSLFYLHLAEGVKMRSKLIFSTLPRSLIVALIIILIILINS